MPNWCDTEINIHGTNKDEIKKLYCNLKNWVDEVCIENGFGTNYLGNIVQQSGIATYNIEQKCFNPEFECRGELTSLQNIGNDISLATETAWRPMMKMWKNICDKYLPSGYEIIYWAYEPGYGIYETNDPMYENSYCFNSRVDISSNDCFNEKELNIIKKYESADDYSENDIIDFLSEILDSDEKDIYKLLKVFNESKFNKAIYIKKWDFVQIEDAE